MGPVRVQPSEPALHGVHQDSGPADSSDFDDPFVALGARPPRAVHISTFDHTGFGDQGIAGRIGAVIRDRRPIVGVVVVAAVALLAWFGVQVATGRRLQNGASGPVLLDLPYAAPTPSGSSVAPNGVSGAFAGTGGSVTGVSGGGRVSGSSQTPAADSWVWVHVAGAVKAPGLYRLSIGSRLSDALAAAGGTTASADVDRLNLAQLVSDGERWFIPRAGQVDMPTAISPDGDAPRAGVSGVNGVGSGAGNGVGGGVGAGVDLEPIDLNQADTVQLQTLPGVGPAIADAILQRRAELGRFSSVDDLLDISGIGEGRMSRWRDRLVVK